MLASQPQLDVARGHYSRELCTVFLNRFDRGYEFSRQSLTKRSCWIGRKTDDSHTGKVSCLPVISAEP